MTKLRLADTLQLPEQTVTEKLAFIGTTGAGKSYAATKLAELFWSIRAQLIVLDPVGIWYGLRLQQDGKRPSQIKIPIFGGLHGDVPLEPTAGTLVADLVVDRELSVILDVSQFESDMQKARFAKDFADRFYFRKKAAPSAVHLFLEEVQEFVPQNPQKGEEGMLHAFTRMQKLGRNFGIGSSYITQRPQEVNKKALNLAQTLFVFRTTGLHERKSIEAWVQEKGLDQDIAADLPKLSTGHCHVWSPEFLKVSQVATIAKKDTFNASATPQVGDQRQAQTLAPIDLEKIRTDMAATIEKAKADDPKELHRQLSQEREKNRKLELELATTPAPAEVVKEVPVVLDEDIKRLAELVQSFHVITQRVSEQSGLLGDVISKVVQSPKPSVRTHAHASPRVTTRHDVSTRVHTQAPRQLGKTAVPTYSREEFERDRYGTQDKIGTGERKILTVLAQYPSGKETLPLAHLAGYTVNGHFKNMLGFLRSHGYCTTGQPVRITDEGMKVLGPFDPLPTGEELRQYWMNKVETGEARILGVLINRFPGELSTAELAEQSRYTVNGHFKNMLGHLRTIGLVEGRGFVRASSTLFE